MVYSNIIVQTINYSNRLEKTYKKYINESVNLNLTILDFIEKYYHISEHKKLNNLYKLIDKINITINSVQITSDNLSEYLNIILDDKTTIIYIVIQVKVNRDLDGYNNMKNLLTYLHTINDLSVVSENSYNVEDIINNDLSLNKNILQQTQYIHLFRKVNTDNINIILYDMEFFLKINGYNIEQIYIYSNLIEQQITEFKIYGNEKIKKFIKPAGKYLEVNSKFPNHSIAKKYIDNLNIVLKNIIHMQITWYILNYKTVIESDNIKEIIKNIDIPFNLIRVYPFSG